MKKMISLYWVAGEAKGHAGNVGVIDRNYGEVRSWLESKNEARYGGKVLNMVDVNRLFGKGGVSMKRIFEELKERALPKMEAYYNDLLVHDKNSLTENPTTPFIHCTGTTGTYLVFFHSIDKYPAKGERVKYLFGYADREHIMRSSTLDIIEYLPKSNRIELIQYYDGNKLAVISYAAALQLTEAYVDSMMKQFKAD